jgi:oxygen-independent coproporphyrinogen-3 oxidase
MATDTSNTTEVGSYFVSNYPPFSLWKHENIHEIESVLNAEPEQPVPLGIYLHIPFCRKRCKFCYFRVYTNQNAQAIETYVQSLVKEVELLSELPGVQNRELKLVYFGGGTPSYLSAKQLRSLKERLNQSITWDDADEVTFECEPGTLSQDKVNTLKDIGVTRVSLGIENFNDAILEANGRAHLSPEVHRAYDWIQQADFPQVNVDLIAGMIGEDDENWAMCVDKVLEMAPDNITIYQMELPFNTIISKEIKELGITSPIANWATKRRWVNEAFEKLMANGYHISSGNELVKNPETDRFIYRDNLFRGSDLLAVGVSSFGHFQGVHYQNLDQIEDYMETVQSGQLPINRALKPTAHQLLIRELILQMKEGHLNAGEFREKFGVEIREEFSTAFANQEQAGYLTTEGDEITLTRKGLLQVDSLLTEYFEVEHRQVRYT